MAHIKGDYSTWKYWTFLVIVPGGSNSTIFPVISPGSDPSHLHMQWHSLSVILMHFTEGDKCHVSKIYIFSRRITIFSPIMLWGLKGKEVRQNLFTHSWWSSKYQKRQLKRNFFNERKKANASSTDGIIIALVFQLVWETTEEVSSLYVFLHSFPPTAFFLLGDSE